MLEKATYLGALRDNSDRLIAAARRDLAAPVPHCPEWTVGDLMDHLGGVYEFAATIAREQAFERETVRAITERRDQRRAERLADPNFARSAALFDWFIAARDDVINQLGQLDPAARVWTLSPTFSEGRFWPRRMAQETAVHRWDVQAAFHATEPVEPELAGDGIDEMFEVMAPRWRSRAKTPGQGETYCFTTSDSGGDWRLRFEADRIVTGAETGNPDVTVRGPAAKLFLFLWHRLPADELEVTGDRALLARYFELVPPN